MLNCRTAFYLIFFLFLLKINLSSQTTLQGTGDFGGISNFTTFNTEHGLALSSIASSCVDKFGNLWFGTYGGGVSRYDGKSFANFTTTNGLSYNVILSVYEDRKGNLWFGTNRNGVCKYDGKTTITYSTKEGLPNNTILSIGEDAQGNLWLGTYGGGASRYDGNKFTTFDVTNGLPGNDVRAIYSDKNGILWLGVIGKGLVKYDGKNFKTFTSNDGLAHNNVWSIVEDNKGHLWISTMGGGISRYDGKTFVNYTQKNGLANENIWCSYKDRAGNLWFGSKGGGVSKYDGNNFYTYTTMQGLPNNYVYSIVEDKSGGIWFGTYGGGVTRYEGKALTSFTVKQGLAANIIYSILQDRKGNYWFGTYNGGVSKLATPAFINNRLNKFITYTQKDGLAINDIKSLYEDKNGNIWFGSSGGGVTKLPRGEGNKFITYSVKDGLSNNKVNTIHQDKNGVMWFGTSGGGLCSFDGHSFKTYTSAQGLANDIILTMIEDRKGNLWLGTSSGVSCFNGKTFTNFSAKQGLIHNTVFSLLEDNQGNIWFGTDGGGVSRYDGKKFQNYTKEDGLGNNTVGQMLQDKAGRIYFATNVGLSILTGWNGDKPVFEIYNKSTGYNIKDVSAGQRGIIEDRDGIIWIATGDDNSALVRFDYNEIKKNKTAPGVVIQNIKLNEKDINWFALYEKQHKVDSVYNFNREITAFGKYQQGAQRENQVSNYSGVKFDDIMAFYPLPVNLSLPYSSNHITFEFAAIETAKPTLVNYQYYLEGYDKEWSPVTNNSMAVFGNMGEGKYIFKVKAQIPGGEWSEPVSYSFTVRPPWYRSSWAFVSYGVLFFALAYAALNIYSRRLKRINIQLEKTIKQRTHEIAFQNEELQKKNEQIILQAEILEETNASKDKFFRIIAHDLRSPIAGFLKLTELMADENDLFSREEFTDISKSLKNSAGNLYKLLNNLLEWATVQQGGLQFEPSEIEIQNLISQNITAVTERARQKKVSIENNLRSSIVIYADEKMINTVLRNLISNAIKFTNSGGRVYIDAVLNNEECIISVGDTGVGMPAEILEKLFKIDEKVSRKGTENEHSTGLGLILCKEFVEMHKGRIWVESREEVGSVFSFSIPKLK